VVVTSILLEVIIMASIGLQDFINNNINKRVEQLKKDFESNGAKEVAERIKSPLERFGLGQAIGFYHDYSPKMYKRTGNFGEAVSDARTWSANGSVFASVGEELRDYEGWFGKPLNADTAWKYMFEQGEHGHGFLNMHNSDPLKPEVEIEFNRLVDVESDKVLSKYLKKYKFD